MQSSAHYQQMDIKGWTALITGASSGIGEACVWRLAELGCRLIICARRTARLMELEKAVKSKHEVDVHAVTLDVSEVKTLEQLPEKLPAEFQEVDILVNNAGLALGTASVHENDVDDSVKMINTNVTAVAILTRIFAEGMRHRNRGHIVNISSIAAHWTYTGGSIYCGTKHFIDAYTNAARHDLVDTNVRVTSISPGAVRTEFSTVRYKGDQEKADAVYDGIIPLSAADCADSVVYALTRPAHVQIGEVILYACHQSAPNNIARVLRPRSLLDELTSQLTSVSK